MIHDTQFDGAEASVNGRCYRLPVPGCPGFIKIAQAAPPDGSNKTASLPPILRHHAARDDGVEERLRPVSGRGRRIRQTHRPKSRCGSFRTHREVSVLDRNGGLSEDSVKFMIDIATESEVLTNPRSADIVDRETLSRAVELANMPTG